MSHSGTAYREAELAKPYDVIVVGGGIYGATMLWEAASRGLRALLVEQSDFGSQTSANSLKTIHGGLRYLQDFDLIRLRQSARERAILQYIAPHLVTPLQCIMPTYPGLTRNRFTMAAGILAHRLFSLGCNSRLLAWQRPPAGGTLSSAALQALVPAIEDGRVTGAARWFDAQAFNTERLVLAFIMSARGRGASAVNYAEATGLLTSAGQVSGVRVHDRLRDQTAEVEAPVVIDCTGAWQLGPGWYGPVTLAGELLRGRSRAWNLVMKRPLAPMAVGFRTLGDTGRLLFIAPWREGAIAGTWYDGAAPGAGYPDRAAVSEALAEINRVFPELDYRLEDVARIHVGWLPRDDNAPQAPEDLAARPAVTDAQACGGPSGLVLVQGVKYTTARKVAQQTVSRLASWTRLKPGKSVSDSTRLYGADFEDFWRFSSQIQAGYKQYSPATLAHLLQNYGSCTKNILQMAEADPGLAQPIPGQTVALRAEVEFVLRHEMAYRLADVLLRRTDLGSLQCPNAEVVTYCLEHLGEALGWNSQDKDAQQSELKATYPELA